MDPCSGQAFTADIFIDKVDGNYYGAHMKRVLNIFRLTLVLAIAMAPLGGAYAGTGAGMVKQDNAGTHCAKMQMDNMAMAADGSCPHHKQADGSQPDITSCEKNCSDCKAANHVAGLAHCPMHTGNPGTDTALSSAAVPHNCPHHDTSQPPRH